MSDHAPVLSGIDDISAFQPEFSRGRFAEFVATQSAPGFLYSLQVIGRSDSVALRGKQPASSSKSASAHSRPIGLQLSFCRRCTQPHHRDAHARLGGGSDALVDGRPPRITKVAGASGARRRWRVWGLHSPGRCARGADTRRLLGLAGGSTSVEIS
jgi:hypothetical protein